MLCCDSKNRGCVMLRSVGFVRYFAHVNTSATFCDCTPTMSVGNFIVITTVEYLLVVMLSLWFLYILVIFQNINLSCEAAPIIINLSPLQLSLCNL